MTVTVTVMVRVGLALTAGLTFALARGGAPLPWLGLVSLPWLGLASLPCALAEAPTILPDVVKATQLGMVRPDGVGITSACWVWSFHTARHEYVVPRSIPMMGPGMVAIRLQSVSLCVYESMRY